MRRMPSNISAHVRSLARFGSLIALFAMCTSCARQPSTGVDLKNTRIIFTATVDGTLKNGLTDGTGSSYVYMVAVRVCNEVNPKTGGPIPVVAPPWGNGFVAGNATHFILWDPTQASPYGIYRFSYVDQVRQNNPGNPVAPYLADNLSPNDLTQWALVGVPIVIDTTKPNQIQFELSLEQLVLAKTDLSLVHTLQFNFLTMDRIPQTGVSKFWDALGDSTTVSGINQYVTVSLDTNGVYNNLRSGDIEPRGDQPNPDLDLVDWQVEVRLQS